MGQELLWDRRTSELPTLPDIFAERNGNEDADASGAFDSGQSDARWALVAASVNATINKELLQAVLRGRAHLGLLAVLNGYSSSHDSLGAPLPNQQRDLSGNTRGISRTQTQSEESRKTRQQLAGQGRDLAQGTSPNARSTDISKAHMLWSRCFLSTAASGPCMSTFCSLS